MKFTTDESMEQEEFDEEKYFDEIDKKYFPLLR